MTSKDVSIQDPPKMSKEEKRLHRAKELQAYYWGALSIVGPRIHALTLILLPTLVACTTAIVIAIFGVIRILVYDDYTFLMKVISNRYLAMLVAAVVWAWGNLFLSVVIGILVLIPTWGIGYFIYALIFPAFYMEPINKYETEVDDQKKIVKYIVKETGHLARLGRVFWVEHESFPPYRMAQKPDRLMWWLCRTPYQRPEWEDRELTHFRIVTDNYSVAKFIIGFYVTDWTVNPRPIWGKGKNGFLSYVAQVGPNTSRHITDITENELTIKGEQRDLALYRSELENSIEKADTRMEATVGLNKYVSTTERLDNVIQKKTQSQKAQEERQLTDKQMMFAAITQEIGARNARNAKKRRFANMPEIDDEEGEDADI